MSDVFISYAPADASWAEMLASQLAGHGLYVSFDEWSVQPGDIVVHSLEQAIRASASGIAVVSSAYATLPRALEEYAALIQASAGRGLRFIPVLLGDVTVPPFAANRVWRDFRNVRGAAFDEKVRELAAVISGQPLPGGATAAAENRAAALTAPPRPVTEPDRHAFVICFTDDDAGYAERLAAHLRRAGLPVWSVSDLLPGDEHFWLIRQQLAYAIGVIVLMSAQSQDSDDITRMILEGQRHGRPLVPVLMHGERNYLLASTWYFDARDGRLPGPGEFGMLRKLHEADVSGRAAKPDQVLPPPLASAAVSAVRVPLSAALRRLSGYLAEGERAHADLLTTALLLEAAGRLGEGCMRVQDGRELPADLLAAVDELWSRHSGGRQGFRAQLACAQPALARVRQGGHAEFLALSVACGWREGVGASVRRNYGEFCAAGDGREGFFPTLRNPQAEQYKGWYDKWWATVLAVHARLGQ